MVIIKAVDLMGQKVLNYPRFLPSVKALPIDAKEAEELYKDVRSESPDCVALHGSRIYGNPRRSSDLDVIEVYDEGKVVYEQLMSKNIEISILKANREMIEEDIESDICGNYLTTKFCRINKPLNGYKEIQELERLCLNKLLIEGMKKMKEPEGALITPSYGMKLITAMRMWYEPQRWWSIHSSLINCPNRNRNIAIYYDKVLNIMEKNDFLKRDGIYEGETVFTIEGVERVPPLIEERFISMYKFAKAQFNASDLRHIFGELYPKVYGMNMALVYRVLGYPELFTF